MKKNLFSITIAMLLGFPAVAASQKPAAGRTPDPTVEKIARAALPVCPKTVKITQSTLERKLPPGMTGVVVNVESEAPICRGMFALVQTPVSYYFGNPWFLEGTSGTIESRIKELTWSRMQETFDATIDRTKKTSGLHPVRLTHTTEYGKSAIDGLVDPAGTVLFVGSFVPLNSDFSTERSNRLNKLAATAPTKGAGNPRVSLVEFSDFQCPSCKNATKFIDPLVKKLGDKIRYTRVDLPLISAHPWAFPAAVAGRAIYKQNPEAFWKYKSAIYENQAELNAFAIEGFASGFAEDSGLDMKRFTADVESAAIRNEVLEGVGAAFSLHIHGTPTFLVNGKVVNADSDGSALERYIAAELDKKPSSKAVSVKKR